MVCFLGEQLECNLVDFSEGSVQEIPMCVCLEDSETGGQENRCRDEVQEDSLRPMTWWAEVDDASSSKT